MGDQRERSHPTGDVADPTPQELAEVLDAFGIPGPRRVRALARGSRRAPKFVVESASGRFLLKRRRDGAGVFALELQAHLAERGLKVPAVARTRRGEFVARCGEHRWELVEFLEGNRYERGEAAARSAGAALRVLHDTLASVSAPMNMRASYHDSTLVRRALESAREEAGTPLDAERLRRVAALSARYEAAAAAVRPHWSGLPASLVHGDFHPGNLLFKADAVAAVLDWEAVRLDARLAEFASAAFHFSLPSRAVESPPREGLRLDLAAAFAAGYGRLEAGHGELAVELIAEAAIAEVAFLLGGVEDRQRCDRLLTAVESALALLNHSPDDVAARLESPR